MTTDQKKAIVVFLGSGFVFLLLKAVFAPAPKPQPIALNLAQARNADKAMVAYDRAITAGETEESLAKLNEILKEEYAVTVQKGEGGLVALDAEKRIIMKS